MNKRDKIVLRQQLLLDFISGFDNGCFWPMQAIMQELDCTQRQLRNDINTLLANKTITAESKGSGRKLYSQYKSDYVIPPLERIKVYSQLPKRGST